MFKFIPVLLSAALLLGGCATPPPRAAPTVTTPSSTIAPAAPVGTRPDDNLNAVAWAQTAIEHDLIYLQTYRDAQLQLLNARRDLQWDALAKRDRVAPMQGLKPAVVLDIDETVLDNSPYQARLIKQGSEYNETGWTTWCKEERARALPGAVAFTQFAVQHGIAVIYLSNRAQKLDTVTLDNLRKVGFPVSGPEAFLGLGTVVSGCTQVGTEKNCRRELISRRYRVLMQFGDQLGDFVSAPSHTEAGRAQAIQPYLGWIGLRWFVLPNPTYGSWESVLFHNAWSTPRDQRRLEKIDSLRTN